MFRRFASLAVVAAGITACADATSPGSPAALASMVNAEAAVLDQSVPNEWIVAVRKNVSDVATEAAKARALGAVVMDVWNVGFRGFSVRVGPEALNRLRQNPNVDYVEPNILMHTQWEGTLPNMDILVVQNCSPYSTCSWGLDRIDETNLPMDGVYFQPNQAPNQGASVTAHVIDTGIRPTHTEYAGRVTNGFDYVNNDPIANDDNGHGSHVAGTIGGALYGVAKQVKLKAWKVCNAGGSCPTTAIINAVNAVTANPQLPSVANMSLGGGINVSIDNAVAASIAAGVAYGIAAGNSFGLNACNFSPARVATATTVASSGNGAGVPPSQIDDRSNFTNTGPCVDIYAPGQNIKSAWFTSDVATNIISGTSMATPHVVGAMALYRDVFPIQTPAQIDAALKSNAKAVITNPGNNTTNKLLNVAVPARP